MLTKYYYLIIYFLCLSLVGCSTPKQDLEFTQAFELGPFLETHIRSLPGQEIEFQILTSQNEAVPYGRLTFQWAEGGRMSFQSDPNGMLFMEFEEDILAHKVTVCAAAKDNKVRVAW